MTVRVTEVNFPKLKSILGYSDARTLDILIDFYEIVFSADSYEIFDCAGDVFPQFVRSILIRLHEFSMVDDAFFGDKPLDFYKTDFGVAITKQLVLLKDLIESLRGLVDERPLKSEIRVAFQTPIEFTINVDI